MFTKVNVYALSRMRITLNGWLLHIVVEIYMAKEGTNNLSSDITYLY